MNVKWIIAVTIVIYMCGLESYPQTAPNIRNAEGNLALSFELLRSTKEHIKFVFELRNGGSKAVLYSTNPQQAGGDLGPYFSTDENDASVVNVQWRVFQRDIVLRAENGGVNKVGVELKRLEPGQTVKGTLSLKWPVVETSPPLLTTIHAKTFDRKDVKRFRFTVGYFDVEEGILELLTRKQFGWFVAGYESLETGGFRGKRLHEIQKLVSFEVSTSETGHNDQGILL
ncbi:MAG: hypothetical protein KIT61_07805 [Pyrinomonadaceae bacterium]|nr:hypothetical protein [Pyrinomonadaceae bacterium]